MGKKKEGLVTLPKATLKRLVEAALKELGHEDTSVSAATLDVINRCCCEYVRLVTSEANDICVQEQKSLVNMAHVTAALQNLGFDDYVEAVDEAGAIAATQGAEARSKKRERRGY